MEGLGLTDIWHEKKGQRSGHVFPAGAPHLSHLEMSADSGPPTDIFTC